MNLEIFLVAFSILCAILVIYHLAQARHFIAVSAIAEIVHINATTLYGFTVAFFCSFR